MSTSPTPEACTPTATNASSHSLASRHQKAEHTANTPGPWAGTRLEKSVFVRPGWYYGYERGR
jgi:hypothetical protein